MKYTVSKSFIQVIGQIWMPSTTAAMTYDLGAWELKQIQRDDGSIDRDAVEFWLMLHSGDFQSITDFYADIQHPDTDENLAFGWEDEKSEEIFIDCIYPSEEFEYA